MWLTTHGFDKKDTVPICQLIIPNITYMIGDMPSNAPCITL